MVLIVTLMTFLIGLAFGTLLSVGFYSKIKIHTLVVEKGEIKLILHDRPMDADQYHIDNLNNNNVNIIGSFMGYTRQKFFKIPIERG